MVRYPPYATRRFGLSSQPPLRSVSSCRQTVQCCRHKGLGVRPPCLVHERLETLFQITKLSQAPGPRFSYVSIGKFMIVLTQVLMIHRERAT